MDKDSDLSNILLRKMRLKDSQFVKEPDAGKLACPVLETIAGGDSKDAFNQHALSRLRDLSYRDKKVGRCIK
jgi:hypothetical protein